MTARMVALKKAVSPGKWRMAMVDCEPGCTDAEAKLAAEIGQTENAEKLWHLDRPKRMFQPSKRTDEEAEEFLGLWNFGEEICIEFNKRMAAPSE